jgi:integrase/recombinase XerD
VLSGLYLQSSTVARIRRSPLAVQLDPFVEYLLGAGYARSTVRTYLSSVQHFAAWTSAQAIDLGEVDGCTVADFARHLRRCRCIGPYHRKRAGSCETVLTAVRHFLKHLRRVGVARPASLWPKSQAILEFVDWMRKRRGTCDTTLKGYCRHVGRLLSAVGDDPRRVDARSLRLFVLRESRRHGVPHSSSVVSALRAFVRFLIATGQCPSNLDGAVPVVAGWRLASMPKFIPYEDVERVIASCDRRTAKGRRDRAILLLLARLALRAGDVRQLRLTDLDWAHGAVVVCGKGQRPVRLPLPQDVGDAILAYLRRGRPRVDSPFVFLRSTPPFGPFHPASLADDTHSAFRRGGVRAPHHGTHLFRHSAATEMLRRGATLDQIQTVLRHASPETTLQYAKVDVEALRAIAQPWPGGASC